MGGQRVARPARLPHRRTGTTASRTAARVPRRGPPGESGAGAVVGRHQAYAGRPACAARPARPGGDRAAGGGAAGPGDDTRPGAPGVRAYPRQRVLHGAARASRRARRQPARAPARRPRRRCGGAMEDPERARARADEARRPGRQPRGHGHPPAGRPPEHVVARSRLAVGRRGCGRRRAGAFPRRSGVVPPPPARRPAPCTPRRAIDPDAVHAAYAAAIEVLIAGTARPRAWSPPPPCTTMPPAAVDPAFRWAVRAATEAERLSAWTVADDALGAGLSLWPDVSAEVQAESPGLLALLRRAARAARRAGALDRRLAYLARPGMRLDEATDPLLASTVLTEWSTASWDACPARAATHPAGGVPGDHPDRRRAGQSRTGGGAGRAGHRPRLERRPRARGRPRRCRPGPGWAASRAALEVARRSGAPRGPGPCSTVQPGSSSSTTRVRRP